MIHQHVCLQTKDFSCKDAKKRGKKKQKSSAFVIKLAFGLHFHPHRQKSTSRLALFDKYHNADKFEVDFLVIRTFRSPSLFSPLSL